MNKNKLEKIALFFCMLLLLSAVRGFSVELGIVGLSAEGEIELLVNGLSASNEVIDVYVSDNGRNWQLKCSDLHSAGAPDMACVLPIDRDVQFFSVARAHLDLDKDGISDSRAERSGGYYRPPVQPISSWASSGQSYAQSGIALIAGTAEDNVLNVKDFGAKGDGSSDDTSAIRSALSSFSSPGVLYFPAGSYRVCKRLYPQSGTIMRGAGAGLTRFLFSGSDTEDRCIGLTRWNSDQIWPKIDVTSGLNMGNTQFVLADVSDFNVGDIVEIEEDNDPEWGLDDSWQRCLPGQIFRVVAVDVQSSCIVVDQPLRIDLHDDRNPTMRRLETVSKVGLEDFYIERSDEVDGYTIEMKYAVDCWVKGVESSMTYKAHVWMDNSLSCTVRESYFHDAYVYGGGGQGYGVCAGRHTSSCLIENNVFDHLRHSMIVGSGANGNVFGYNFSINRALDPVRQTPQADISVHGNFVFMNLFEGNVVEDADVPDWYHPAGPANTLFRNSILNDDEAVEVASEGQIVIGNELPNGYITCEAGIAEVIMHGNCEQGTVQWSADGEGALPPSFYRPVCPEFIYSRAGTCWPAFGPDTLADLKVPAQLRYEAGQYIP